MLLKTSLLLSLNLLICAADPVQPRAADCSTVAVNPPPKGYNCGTLGKLKHPSVLAQPIALTPDDCRDSCFGMPKCISYGFNEMSRTCKLFNKTLWAQGYRDKTTNNGFVYYNRRHCFKMDCTTTGPTPTPTPTPDPCLTSLPPVGDTVTNGGFECGLDPWTVDSDPLVATYAISQPAQSGSNAFIATTASTFTPDGTPSVTLSQTLTLVPGVAMQLQVGYYLTSLNQRVGVYLNGVEAFTIREYWPLFLNNYGTTTGTVSTGIGGESVLEIRLVLDPSVGSIVGIDNVSYTLQT